jgi:hypothetical protein
MLRSYENAKRIFDMKAEGDHISYKLFDLPHGYAAEDRSAMLGWFNYHLKGIGTGEPAEEKPFDLLPETDVMVFEAGKRDADVVTTEEFCRLTGNELRSEYLNTGSFDMNSKKSQLAEILRIKDKPVLKRVHDYGASGGWSRIALETSDNKIIPLLLSNPTAGFSEYVIVTNPMGKNEIPGSLIEDILSSGKGAAVVDLTGCGELSSAAAANYDRERVFHTIARAELWLGKTTIGEWAKELNLVAGYIRSNYNVSKISVDGTKETALAGLFLSALENSINEVILRDAPISYLFDKRENVDFFNMAVHLPGFLKWGDVSLAAALTGKDVTFIDPVTMSCRILKGDELEEFTGEFEKIRSSCGQSGSTFLK